MNEFEYECPRCKGRGIVSTKIKKDYLPSPDFVFAAILTICPRCSGHRKGDWIVNVTKNYPWTTRLYTSIMDDFRETLSKDLYTVNWDTSSGIRIEVYVRKREELKQFKVE